VVLAGGQSRRFGSDKALAQFRGGPLLSYVLDGLSRIGFSQIVLSAKEPQRYAAIAGAGVELVTDEHAAQTPLAGLLAGLKVSRYELVFACAADMPFAADAALIDALSEAVRGQDAAVPRGGGADQPLCAVWRRAPALAAAEKLLMLLDPPGPRALAEQLRTVRIDWPNSRPFLDADTQEALNVLEQ
jgi:molybdopterin-guanine dinucleotide biosynthesis protein A